MNMYIYIYIYIKLNDTLFCGGWSNVLTGPLNPPPHESKIYKIFIF